MMRGLSMRWRHIGLLSTGALLSYSRGFEPRDERKVTVFSRCAIAFHVCFVLSRQLSVIQMNMKEGLMAYSGYVLESNIQIPSLRSSKMSFLWRARKLLQDSMAGQDQFLYRPSPNTQTLTDSGYNKSNAHVPFNEELQLGAGTKRCETLWNRFITSCDCWEGLKFAPYLFSGRESRVASVTFNLV